MSAWKPGDLATWERKVRGSFAGAVPVLCIPVEVMGAETTAGRVRVKAPLKDGGDKLVTVRAASLRARAAACGRED